MGEIRARGLATQNKKTNKTKQTNKIKLYQVTRSSRLVAFARRQGFGREEASPARKFRRVRSC